MENIIDKINAKGAEIRTARINEEEARINSLKAKVQRAVELLPRIEDMWKIAEAMIRNNFRIGEKKTWVSSDYYTLETDAYSHYLGFCTNNGTHVSSFGVAGGGCCGSGFRINRNGSVNVNIDLFTKDWQYSDLEWAVDRFLDEFDGYEQQFYEFAEKLAA